MFCEFLQTLLAEFLFGRSFLGADERPRQNQGIFDEVGDVEHQSAAPGFTVHHGKAMRYAQYPERTGCQTISQIIAMIEKQVCTIRIVIVTDKIFLLSAADSRFIEVFGKLGFNQ